MAGDSGGTDSGLPGMERPDGEGSSGKLESRSSFIGLEVGVLSGLLSGVRLGLPAAAGKKKQNFK